MSALIRILIGAFLSMMLFYACKHLYPIIGSYTFYIAMVGGMLIVAVHAIAREGGIS